eukprot:INCI14124.1.p5 GENE.INCI14124.1~~INCI14124.1.p5  ORF type:complete len:112 (-),score=17.99 INCI14124.1:494-829(-)
MRQIGRNIYWGAARRDLGHPGEGCRNPLCKHQRGAEAHIELAGAAAATKNAKAMHVLGESSTRLGAVMPKQRQVLKLQKKAIRRLKSVATDVLLHHQVVQAAADGPLDRAV